MPEPQSGSPAPRAVRFEATIHPGPRHQHLDEVPALDLDRVPGPGGEVRVLIGLDDVARVVELGFEVHLRCAHPVKPLDAALVLGDDAVRSDLEAKLATLLEGDS